MNIRSVLVLGAGSAGPMAALTLNRRLPHRAVIAGWPRTDEPIKPKTVAETMETGWCWQIEHENWINRGSVSASPFMSDDAARDEFLRKNPQAAHEPRVVK